MLERPGEVVTREELQKRLWPDGTFVDFDHSVNNAINKIREVLGDSAESPRFVETLVATRLSVHRSCGDSGSCQARQASVDGNGRSSLDSSESSPVEPSSQLSKNEAVIEPPVPPGPVNFGKPQWLSRRGKLLASGLVLLSAASFSFLVVAASPNSSGSTFTYPTDFRPRINHRCGRFTRWKTDRLCFGPRRKQSRHLGKASLRRRSLTTNARSRRRSSAFVLARWKSDCL